MIRIRNIYHMLAYAFQLLNEKGYRQMATEDFENVAELCAAILIRGVRVQVKQGLGKEYVPRTETIPGIRGKIELSESINTQSVYRGKLVCSYDEFIVDSRMNQIIKSTMVQLLKADIRKEQKKEIRKLLVYFSDVNLLDLTLLDWNLHYNRNNQTYRMLIAVCRLIVEGLLQTQADGSAKMMDFLDEQRMCRLYEKFILEYYKKEFPQLSVNASQIKWQVDDGISDMLPKMQTDIMLSYGEKVLIIDAKYYQHSMQMQYEKQTLHSANIYQIFTYVKNKEVEMSGQPHEVSGMLLYARTDEDTYPANDYRMSGNRISARALNLDEEFSVIQKQLNSIAYEFLGVDVA